MSEFPELEGFSNAPSGGGGNSDFLARERELLGDEFGGAPADYNPSDFQSGAGAASGGFPDLDGGNDAGFDMVDEVRSPPTQRSAPPPAAAAPTAAQPVSVTGNDDLAAFESQFPEIEQPSAPSHQANGFGAPAQSLYNEPSSSFAAPSVYASTAMPEEDSEHIKAWREKQAEEIRARDERSKTKREETIVAAEKAIDDFYNNYNNQKEKNIARNKEQEAAFLQARDDALGQGTTWQRIADLIELQDSRSKTTSKATRDLTRFKEVLLSLKRDGENAPGAAGY